MDLYYKNLEKFRTIIFTQLEAYKIDSIIDKDQTHIGSHRLELQEWKIFKK